jgi:hypothetical protein
MSEPAVLTEPCPVCYQPRVPEYPHNHTTPPRPDFDPMPGRVDDLPLNFMLTRLRYEWRAELPLQLHVHYPPSQTEPIPIVPHHPEGAVMFVIDAGHLGGAAWSMPAHRRFGAITSWEGEHVISGEDWRIFPLAYILEKQLPAHCRRRHVTRPELYVEHHGQPICQPIIRALLTVEQAPISHLLNHDLPLAYGMTPQRLALVATEGVRYLWRSLAAKLNEIDIQPRRTLTEPSPAA